MHPDSLRLLERLLKMLAVRGEDETFAYVRKILRHDRQQRLREFLHRNEIRKKR